MNLTKLNNATKWLSSLAILLSPGLTHANEMEVYVTLDDIVEELDRGGYSELAETFMARGFHPDGIKPGVPCTPTENNLYVNSLATGSVLEIDPTGNIRPYVNPKRGEAYGSSFDANGNLFISRIVRFKKAGGIDVIVAGSEIPSDGQTCFTVPNSTTTANDLVVSSDGRTLYFSDDTGGRIFKCDVELEQQTPNCDCQPWLKNNYTASFAGVFGGVDGLVLDEENQTLYFNSFLKGKMYKVDINEDGSAGTSSPLTAKSVYGFGDGMSRGGTENNTLYTASFKLLGGSAVTATNMETGDTELVIEDTSNQTLNPGAALTVDRSGTYETLYISSLDMAGYLLGYRAAQSDGGKIVRAILNDQPLHSEQDTSCAP